MQMAVVGRKYTHLRPALCADAVFHYHVLRGLYQAGLVAALKARWAHSCGGLDLFEPAVQLAVSLNSLGRARYFAGHFEPASAAYQRGLELRRRAGKPWEVATALNNPAMVLTALGQIAQACMVLDECPATDARHQFCA